MNDQIKLGMVRAETKDGMKVGWYAYICSPTLVRTFVWNHVLFVPNVPRDTCDDINAKTEFFVIEDISTAAGATDKKDKNDKMIFGSRGPMLGGDKIEFSIFDHNDIDTQYVGQVRFHQGSWIVWVSDTEVFELYSVAMADPELAIIKAAVEGI